MACTQSTAWRFASVHANKIIQDEIIVFWHFCIRRDLEWLERSLDLEYFLIVLFRLLTWCFHSRWPPYLPSSGLAACQHVDWSNLVTKRPDWFGCSWKLAGGNPLCKDPVPGTGRSGSMVSRLLFAPSLGEVDCKLGSFNPICHIKSTFCSHSTSTHRDIFVDAVSIHHTSLEYLTSKVLHRSNSDRTRASLCSNGAIQNIPSYLHGHHLFA